jgi:hypothetical protein
LTGTLTSGVVPPSPASTPPPPLDDDEEDVLPLEPLEPLDPLDPLDPLEDEAPPLVPKRSLVVAPPHARLATSGTAARKAGDNQRKLEDRRATMVPILTKFGSVAATFDGGAAVSVLFRSPRAGGTA